MSQVETPVLPVYPLPDAVLFPGIVLPLQIVDGVYRQMVADCVAGNGQVVMVWSGGSPLTPSISMSDVGCVGRIIHRDHESGSDNILVQGCERVRLLEEVNSPVRYKRFRVEMIPRASESLLKAAQREIALWHSAVVNLGTVVKSYDADLLEVLRATSDPIDLIDILSAVLVGEVQEQQRLLATGDLGVRMNTLLSRMVDLMAHGKLHPAETTL